MANKRASRNELVPYDATLDPFVALSFPVFRSDPQKLGSLVSPNQLRHVALHTLSRFSPESVPTLFFSARGGHSWRAQRDATELMLGVLGRPCCLVQVWRGSSHGEAGNQMGGSTRAVNLRARSANIGPTSAKVGSPGAAERYLPRNADSAPSPAETGPGSTTRLLCSTNLAHDRHAFRVAVAVKFRLGLLERLSIPRAWQQSSHFGLGPAKLVPFRPKLGLVAVGPEIWHFGGMQTQMSLGEAILDRACPIWAASAKFGAVSTKSGVWVRPDLGRFRPSLERCRLDPRWARPNLRAGATAVRAGSTNLGFVWAEFGAGPAKLGCALGQNRGGPDLIRGRVAVNSRLEVARHHLWL